MHSLTSNIATQKVGQLPPGVGAERIIPKPRLHGCLPGRGFSAIPDENGGFTPTYQTNKNTFFGGMGPHRLAMNLKP